MVDVKSKRCRHEGCSKHPSFGIDGSKSPTFCAQHAAEGMVDVINKRCRHEGRSKHPYSSKEALGTTNSDHVNVELKLETL